MKAKLSYLAGLILSASILTGPAKGYSEIVFSEKLMTDSSFDLYADSRSESVAHLIPKNLKGTYKVEKRVTQPELQDCTEIKTSISQLKSLRNSQSAQSTSRTNLKIQKDKITEELEKTQDENRAHRNRIDTIKAERLSIQLELKKLKPEDPRYKELVQAAAKLADESSQLLKLLSKNSERIVGLNKDLLLKTEEIAQLDSEISKLNSKIQDLSDDLKNITAEIVFNFDYDDFLERSQVLVKKQFPQIQTLLISKKQSGVSIESLGAIEWNTPFTLNGAEIICDLSARPNLFTTGSDTTYGLTYNPLFPFLTGSKVFELHGKLKTLEKARDPKWTPVRHVIEATSFIFDYLPKNLEKSKRGKALLEIFESYYFVSRTDYSESELVEESTLDQTFHVPEEIELPYMVKWEFKNEGL